MHVLSINEKAKIWLLLKDSSNALNKLPKTIFPLSKKIDGNNYVWPIEIIQEISRIAYLGQEAFPVSC